LSTFTVHAPIQPARTQSRTQHESHHPHPGGRMIPTMVQPGADSYRAFIDTKSHIGGDHGFEPLWMPDFLFDFQRSLVEWAVRRGRAAIFADCGLGKTPMQLVWAENVCRKTNGKVLIFTPLAVAAQTVREAEKFHIDCQHSRDGKAAMRITVTNYERLQRFDPQDFAGVVCDESSILKNFAGVRRKEITEFTRKIPHRLLCTATAAPNDFVELGTSAEALGELGHMDMLARFFKNDDNTSFLNKIKYGDFTQKGWRFKAHAEEPFWRWVCSWARAIRKPSDLGFDDAQFVLPELVTNEYRVVAATKAPGFLFEIPAMTLKEQAQEQARTVQERCEKAAELVNCKNNAIAWCHLNPEGDLLEHLIHDAVQVSGSDSEEVKEGRFLDFAAGNIRVLVTKCKIGGFGMNFQNCAHQTFFPSHSFEQWYQAIRRSWRFGQTKPVRVDIVSTEGTEGIMDNLRRKAAAAEKMFSSLVGYMHKYQTISRTGYGDTTQELPSWL